MSRMSVRSPSLLLRRFVFRMAEASAKRVTGDEPQGPLSPSRLPLRAHFHQKRDVWVRGRRSPITKILNSGKQTTIE